MTMITWNLRLHVRKRITPTEPDNTVGYATLFNLKSEALPRVGEVVALDHDSFGTVFELLHMALVDQSLVTHVEHSLSADEDGGSVFLTVHTTPRYGASSTRLHELPHWMPVTD